MEEHNSSSPAQLWIGSDAFVSIYAEQYLQRIYCLQKGCRNCTICVQISQRQHHACLWFYPENSYTLDTLKPFFSTITRSLNHQEKFFFIFHHADYLSVACSNSLLKSIEEPPPGYHIIFLAQHLQAVAPTLRSRCAISHFTADATLQATYELLPFFTTQNPIDFEIFLQILEKTALDDRTTTGTLEQVLEYWIKEYKKQTQTSYEQKIQNNIEILHHALEKPPMPGSSKIFWRNLFLKLQ